ncbi:helix-turn-helix domain-containing protein [Shouchella tritolerans]|uniref:helix-turn-helix domain-containing protein n=1 Tax=Shouchella tritolerans TaxID=2979466 RepID=UPI0021E98D5C|nr:helix-turn-helix domain-containing protein [Shouchella tritolerans]
MGIFRVSKTSNYVVMNRTGLNDKRLSWKAKGLLAYMLSMPDDWTFHDTELEKHAKDGRDSLKSAIKELKDHKYMKRTRRKGEGGKFVWETAVFEQPYTDFPSMENPFTENPSMEIPSMENPQLLSTDIPSIDVLSIDKPSTDKKTEQKPAPGSYSTEFEEFWKLYPRKVDKKMAYRKWREVRKKHSAQEIMDGLAGYKREIEQKKTATEYIKHAKTFLHNECFKEYEGGAEVAESSGRNEYEGYNFDKEFTPNF